MSAYYTKYRKKKMKTGRVESVSMGCQLVVSKKVSKKVPTSSVQKESRKKKRK